MVIKFFQASIVAFWLVMTVLLVRTVYFPEQTRFTRVPPAQILESFLKSEKNYQLLIMERGSEVGHVMVSSARRDGGDADNEPAYEMVLAGKLKLKLPPSGETAMRYKIELLMDETAKIHSLKLEVTPDQVRKKLRFELKPTGEGVDYCFSVDDEVLLASYGGVTDASPEIQMLLAAWGMDPSMLMKKKDEMAQGLPEVIGRKGAVEVRGMLFSAYTLEFPIMGERGLRFCFTRYGELMQVEGLFGYEVISEDLYPVVHGAVPTTEP